MQAQKKTALRLWCMHTGREVITAGIDLPVEEIEWFELAWDPHAPARCRACKGPVAGVRAGFHAREPYCNEACRAGSGREGSTDAFAQCARAQLAR